MRRRHARHGERQLPNGLGAEERLSECEELRARLNLDADLQAPVAVGDNVGTLEVYLGEEMVGERQLVALENIEEGGLFKRLFDQVQRFFSNLISNFTS